MTKMNWDRANKIQRTGKAQSEHTEADRPPGISVEDILRTPEQVATANEYKFKIEEERRELEEERRKLEVIRHLREAEKAEERKISRDEFLKNKEHLLQEFTEVLGCKPDGSDAWPQLQKLIKVNPGEKSKYWLAYHRLNEIVNTFY